MIIEKNVINKYKHIFPNYITDEFLFPLEDFLFYLECLSINPLDFYQEWSDINRQNLIKKYLKNNTRLDWKWGLSFPFFSFLEKYIDNIISPKIIGFSALPGSGKSTLGFWIENLARDLNLEIKVISLDDFYLPGEEMDIAMSGNPWNAPRGYPGSHSIELLKRSLEDFLKNGVIKSPIFDKSLRDGKGDRSGWSEVRCKVLILEGWFVGCEPITNLSNNDYVSEDKLNLGLSQSERDYRNSIQKSLFQYSQIWSLFDKIWHLKSSQFNNTILWKTQQEEEMIKLKGSGLKDNSLTNFIRMIQTSIPQQSLSCISADTTIEINQMRRINKLNTNTYRF